MLQCIRRLAKLGAMAALVIFTHYCSEPRSKYARAPGKAAMAWQFFPARAYFERGLDLEIQGGGGRRNQGQGHQKSKEWKEIPRNPMGRRPV